MKEYFEISSTTTEADLKQFSWRGHNVILNLCKEQNYQILTAKFQYVNPTA